jgi:hypothetical protein
MNPRSNEPLIAHPALIAGIILIAALIRQLLSVVGKARGPGMNAVRFTS